MVVLFALAKGGYNRNIRWPEMPEWLRIQAIVAGVHSHGLMKSDCLIDWLVEQVERVWRLYISL